MDTPFFRREKGISKLWQQMETIHVLKIVFPPLLQQFWNDCTLMYKYIYIYSFVTIQW